LNAHLDWTFYKLHHQMMMNPTWSVQKDFASSGDPCLQRGDPTFPQPTDGLLCVNHTKMATRTAFVSACLNATTLGGFDGCFIDSAGVANDAGQAAYAQRCNTSTALMAELGKGTTMLLDDLQTAVGPTKLIIAKDDFSGGSEASVNSIMPMDTFCSCYNCDPNTWSTKVFREGMTYAGICQTQIQESIKRGKRGQVSVLHGEVNAWLGVNRTALENDFTFTLASFLIAASDSSFFGYSKGWYYNGTTWHAAYDNPLGAPTNEAMQGSGLANMSWSRSFASGTTVELDVLAHTATIEWAANNSGPALQQ